MMNFQIIAACGCDIGRRRENNEDNFYFDGLYLPEDNNGLSEVCTKELQSGHGANVAVFDGMGGQADGQVASHIAAETFDQMIKASGPKGNSRSFLERCMESLTNAVWKRAEADFSNTGTTAALLRMNKVRYAAANVGDSRIYRYRNKSLIQLSMDHTDEATAVQNGKMKRKPSLTQYVGISPEELAIEPYIVTGNLHVGDQFLLCSDGLTDMVDQSCIKKVLGQRIAVAEKVEKLIQAALSNGGRDNVTVVVVEVVSQDVE